MLRGARVTIQAPAKRQLIGRVGVVTDVNYDGDKGLATVCLEPRHCDDDNDDEMDNDEVVVAVASTITLCHGGSARPVRPALTPTPMRTRATAAPCSAADAESHTPPSGTAPSPGTQTHFCPLRSKRCRADTDGADVDGELLALHGSRRSRGLPTTLSSGSDESLGHQDTGTSASILLNMAQHPLPLSASPASKSPTDALDDELLQEWLKSSSKSNSTSDD